MIRETYQQDRTKDRIEPIIEGNGLTSLELTDNVFEGVYLFIPGYSFDSLTKYEASHTVQWSGRKRNSREFRPSEIGAKGSHRSFNAYVMSDGSNSHFSDNQSQVFLTASPDVGSRIFFSYITSRGSADLVQCDEYDGSDKTFQDLLFGRGRRNPFKIRRLDNLQVVVDQYLAEVTLDGIMFGSDSELLVEQGLARRLESGLISLNEEQGTLVRELVTDARKSPRYAEFGEKKHHQLGSIFYRTMHRRLDDIFRKCD